MAARRLLGLAALASAEYPGNFALTFKAEHGDIVRIPHEVSMQGPLIDSFTVELWVLVQPGAQLYPDEGRVVNLVGFPGRHPFLGLASDTGCACIQLKLANGTWYSYEGVTPIDDGQWHHVAATWDGTAPDPIERELALYVDGELEAAGGLDDDASDVPKTPEALGITVVSSCEAGLCEEGMHVGGLYCCQGGGYTGRYLNGTIDELRVWTRALPQDEIASKMYTPLYAGDELGLLFYFPLDEAGMETGANVVESRALQWYGILGNARGQGRPSWTVSNAPLMCTQGSRAPICQRIESDEGGFGLSAALSAVRAHAAADDGYSVAIVLFVIFATASAAFAAGAILTYASLKGGLPPAAHELLSALGHVAQAVGDGIASLLRSSAHGTGYAPPSGGGAGRMAPAADWTWASPPRVGDAPTTAVGVPSGSGGAGATGGPAPPPPREQQPPVGTPSYGGL